MVAGAAGLLVALGTGVAACGDDDKKNGGDRPSTAAAGTDTTRVEAIQAARGNESFDPNAIYRRDAPGVVTVISEFEGGGQGLLDQDEGGGQRRGLGSGFVLSGSGEIATNAHVVTTGEGARIRRARNVYVEFPDGNQVPARIVGQDPNADVALLRVDPAGLTLRPLPLGAAARVRVGEPVVAIGSPFGEPESLSVGVVSALDRDIESLTSFRITGAIQTDAAINSGNSGGPLVNARGEVIGINSQIRSTSGGNVGVGFAVSIDTVKRSLNQLREDGDADYAYVGISSVSLFPQLARRFGLPVRRGVWVQEVVDGAPADKAGIRGGNREVRFQIREYRVGGDVLTRMAGRTLEEDQDLSKVIETLRPGQEVEVELYRGDERRTVRIKLGERPADAGRRRP
jgi:2-alkenal reductase